MRKFYLFLFCFLLTSCSVTEEQKIPEPSTIPDVEIKEELPLNGETIPETPEEPEKIYINHQEEGGEFELPLYGTSGFTGVSTAFTDAINGTTLETLPPGTGFYILEEEGNWWKIALENREGWLENTDCLVNLPDLIPSIVYENPYANVCYSCSLGKDIPHVTGERLYDALFFNNRLDDYIYLTPVLYETAKKLNRAQQSALADGNSLLIYECYRPYSVQRQLVDGLDLLMQTDREVNQALTTAPWSKAWFVSTGISDHQRGRSIDMTLVHVDEIQEKNTGDFKYSKIIRYTEHAMPTQFDELSPLAATFTGPVSTSGDAWKSATLSDTMTEGAILLQKYATDVGLVPLASEWWHFNDTNSGSGKLLGDFMLSACFSVKPYVEFH